MSKPSRQLLDDLQASTPEVALGLSRAGVTGVQKAVRIGRGSAREADPGDDRLRRRPRPLAEGRPHVALPRALRGGDRGGRHDDAFLIEDLAEHVANRIVERQDALVAEVHITARYPYERRTPVTGLATQEMVSLIGIAAASRQGVRRDRRRRGGRHQRLPVRAGTRARPRVGAPARSRLRGGDVERILELVPIATHNQRGQGTLFVGTTKRVDAERLVELVEASMSSPIYELLKRPDELFVVEHAHLQPRFVEDSVRVALKSVVDELPGLDDGDFVLSRQVNFETIHAHEVVAERYGTIGELRGELAGAGHGPLRHTELRDWLRGRLVRRYGPSGLRLPQTGRGSPRRATSRPRFARCSTNTPTPAATPAKAITGHG